MSRNQSHEKLSTKHEDYVYVQGFTYKYIETTLQFITELN